MKALILKNIQNDFLSTGAFPLTGTDTIAEEINKVIRKYDIIIALQKWYPADYKSFAANHPWRKPGQVITVDDKEVTLHIMHCVENSFGAALIGGLDQESIHYIIKDTGKGSDPILAEINHIVQKHKIEELDVMGPEEE